MCERDDVIVKNWITGSFHDRLSFVTASFLLVERFRAVPNGNPFK